MKNGLRVSLATGVCFLFPGLCLVASCGQTDGQGSGIEVEDGSLRGELGANSPISRCSPKTISACRWTRLPASNRSSPWSAGAWFMRKDRSRSRRSGAERA